MTAIEQEMQRWLCVATMGGIAGVGVDVEQIRPLDPEVRRFFVHRDDPECVTGADVVGLWALKEAVFKATPRNEHHMLLDFVIDEYKTSAFDTRGGRAYACAAWQSGTGEVIAIAVCRPSSEGGRQ